MTDDTRERLVRLETEMEHLTLKLDRMSTQLDQLVALLNNAKGVRWVLVIIAGAAGFFASKLSVLIPGFPTFPK